MYPTALFASFFSDEVPECPHRGGCNSWGVNPNRQPSAAVRRAALRRSRECTNARDSWARPGRDGGPNGAAHHAPGPRWLVAAALREPGQQRRDRRAGRQLFLPRDHGVRLGAWERPEVSESAGGRAGGGPGGRGRVDEPTAKRPNEYPKPKPREVWTDEEVRTPTSRPTVACEFLDHSDRLLVITQHQKFKAALDTYGRDWAKVTDAGEFRSGPACTIFCCFSVVSGRSLTARFG